jgi:hypothetical protein
MFIGIGLSLEKNEYIYIYKRNSYIMISATSYNNIDLVSQHVVTQINSPIKTVHVEKKQILWNNTSNFKDGLYTMHSNLEHIAGETVYGKGRGHKKEAVKSVTSYLERSSHMDVFKCVEGGTIIKSPPTKEDCITKLKELGTRALKYYSSLSYEQTEVTDHWAGALRGIRRGTPLNISVPSEARILKRDGKRFSGKPITPKDQVIDIIKSSRGMLAEGFVISFLNSGLRCPECKSVGHIGWCDGVTHRSVDAFRDAVCMNCYSNGDITLFEIKTRWEKVIQKSGNGTYAGNFVALNTLMTLNANVYLVLASRDTGDVRVGKITSAKMRGNHNWLYALQEGLKWGAPSSFVTCANGFMKCPVTMQPLIKTITDSFIEEVTSEALKGVDGLKK